MGMEPRDIRLLGCPLRKHLDGRDRDSPAILPQKEARRNLGRLRVGTKEGNVALQYLGRLVSERTDPLLLPLTYDLQPVLARIEMDILVL